MQAAHVLAICIAESLVAAPHSTGMSTFSTKGGLYERAARRFGLADGKRLFSYSFFEKQRLEALVGIPFPMQQLSHAAGYSTSQSHL